MTGSFRTGDKMLFGAAVAAALVYWGAILADADGAGVIALKGCSVALLALLAATRARTFDGWLLAGFLALGAIGDVLIDAIGLTEGAIAFFAGHLIATWLFLRNRRRTLTPSQRLLGLLIVPTVVLIAWRLPADRGDASGIALYALALSIMAATAWTSRFPRYRTGIGAILFVVSDLLIFARMGPLTGSAIPDILVWPIYFAAQALIAVGVIATLAADHREFARPVPVH